MIDRPWITSKQTGDFRRFSRSLIGYAERKLDRVSVQPKIDDIRPNIRETNVVTLGTGAGHAEDLGLEHLPDPPRQIAWRGITPI